MKKTLLCVMMSSLVGAAAVMAQSEGDIIINEIGNNGTAKGAYAGGDYVELLVLKPGGVRLAGWYLTDLSSLTGNPKATEGRIRFSDAEGSVFRQTIPQGTYILVWLSSKDSVEEVAKQQEDISLSDGNKCIAVFAYDSPKQIDMQEGCLNLTGKDNLALLKSWSRDAAIDAALWGGTSKWTGCKPVELPAEALTNGMIAWFAAKVRTLSDFRQRSDPQYWKSSPDSNDATPGRTNKAADDSVLIPKKE